jgi:hypothetical protein
MFVHLAREAPVAVILRRGPSDWWRVTLWDTKNDTFERGQWFHGRLYPERCDVSPDGKLFAYFAGKFNRRAAAGGYRSTWNAVSRPPYLTALALWPVGDTWGGDAVFLDSRTLLLGISEAKAHPDHPAGPLHVLTRGDFPKHDPRHQAVPGWLNGWMRDESRPEVRRQCGELQLARYVPLHASPSRKPTHYMLYAANGEPAALFDAHWADWDQQGRLVATIGGRVLAGRLTNGNSLQWRQLADFQEERPESLETPAWAQRW